MTSELLNFFTQKRQSISIIIQTLLGRYFPVLLQTNPPKITLKGKARLTKMIRKFQLFQSRNSPRKLSFALCLWPGFYRHRHFCSCKVSLQIHTEVLGSITVAGQKTRVSVISKFVKFRKKTALWWQGQHFIAWVRNAIEVVRLINLKCLDLLEGGTWCDGTSKELPSLQDNVLFLRLSYIFTTSDEYHSASVSPPT